MVDTMSQADRLKSIIRKNNEAYNALPIKRYVLFESAGTIWRKCRTFHKRSDLDWWIDHQGLTEGSDHNGGRLFAKDCDEPTYMYHVERG